MARPRRVTNWPKHRAVLEGRALAGDTESMADLGLLLRDGIQDRRGRAIVRRNLKKSFFLLCRAADRGHDVAACALGYAYDCGLGTVRNRNLALRWYKRAWRAGESAAATNIATVYRDERKHRIAFQWWKRSESLDDGDAAVDVGYCYQYGIGTRRSVPLAKRMYRRAISSANISAFGREEAMYHLAIAYVDDGRVSSAIPHLARAATDGDFPEASSLLRQIRLKGNLRPCRCRREMDKWRPGHAVCDRHARSRKPA